MDIYQISCDLKPGVRDNFPAAHRQHGEERF